MKQLILETNLHLHPFDCNRNSYQRWYDENIDNSLEIAIKKSQQIANEESGCVLNWEDADCNDDEGYPLIATRGFDVDGELIATIKGVA